MLEKVISKVSSFAVKLVKDEKGEGWGLFISLAVSICIGAFIVMPQLRIFAIGVFTSMNTWWSNVSSNLFPTS